LVVTKEQIEEGLQLLDEALVEYEASLMSLEGI
jgi:4-aminobutyrate aminotransferase